MFIKFKAIHRKKLEWRIIPLRSVDYVRSSNTKNVDYVVACNLRDNCSRIYDVVGEVETIDKIETQEWT